MQRLLAIESSCDETAACVMGMDGRVYSNIIAVSYTHLDVYKRQGRYNDALNRTKSRETGSFYRRRRCKSDMRYR